MLPITTGDDSRAADRTADEDVCPDDINEHGLTDDELRKPFVAFPGEAYAGAIMVRCHFGIVIGAAIGENPLGFL